MKQNLFFLLLSFGLSLMSVVPAFAQMTEEVVLVFHQEKSSKMYLPRRDLSACIDTLYDNEDTLFIKLTDERIFYLNTNGKMSVRTNYGALICEGFFYTEEAKRFKRKLNIPIVEKRYSFIEMQIYDELCLFRRVKNEYILESRQTLENKTVKELLQTKSLSLDKIGKVDIGVMPDKWKKEKIRE